MQKNRKAKISSGAVRALLTLNSSTTEVVTLLASQDCHVAWSPAVSETMRSNEDGLLAANPKARRLREGFFTGYRWPSMFLCAY